MKYYYEYAGEKVSFSAEEISKIKTFGEPGILKEWLIVQTDSIGLVLLGFKPKTSLKWQYYIKHATFIYPDEQVESSLYNMNLLILLGGNW